MRRLLLCLGLALASLAGPAGAGPWPARTDPFVNDLAGALPDAEESRLRSDLATLRAETGVEMAVLTIASRGGYDPSPSIESFATGVFNAWGIGDGARNDGILVLVVTQDREMRVELGAAYDQGYDVLAQDIVSRVFVPDLREGDLARGIVAGTGEVMARIARRHAARLPPEALPARNGGLPRWLPVAVFAAGAGALVLRRRFGKGRAGMGAAGPAADAVPTTSRWRAGRHHEGRDDRDDGTPRAGGRDNGRGDGRDDGRGDGGRKGGGRSSGGGATGRW